jgi:hypothetical protein
VGLSLPISSTLRPVLKKLFTAVNYYYIKIS